MDSYNKEFKRKMDDYGDEEIMINREMIARKNLTDVQFEALESERLFKDAIDTAEKLGNMKVTNILEAEIV